MANPTPNRRRRLLFVVAAFVVPTVLAVGGALYVQGCSRSIPSGDFPFHYGGYAHVLQHVKPDGDVDLLRLVRDRQELDTFVRSWPRSRRAPGRISSREARGSLAYWLNAYHALVLQAVVDDYPYLESVNDKWFGRFFWDAPGPWAASG